MERMKSKAAFFASVYSDVERSSKQITSSDLFLYGYCSEVLHWTMYPNRSVLFPLSLTLPAISATLATVTSVITTSDITTFVIAISVIARSVIAIYVITTSVIFTSATTTTTTTTTKTATTTTTTTNNNYYAFLVILNATDATTRLRRKISRIAEASVMQ